ncbi:hypothetical protein GOODEAATRI_010618, partial [Goodea atripinnis]
RTRDVMEQFGDLYEKQYAVALFNVVRDPLAGHSIFSGSLFQYLEENRKWRNRFVSVPKSYNVELFESKTACKVTRSALRLVSGIKAKTTNAPFIKCATQFPLILWHPYARHYYFCVMTEKEQNKWHAVLQDCVRHGNNGNFIITDAQYDRQRCHVL